jgi:hypothetical protein
MADILEDQTHLQAALSGADVSAGHCRHEEICVEPEVRALDDIVNCAPGALVEFGFARATK